MALDKELNTKYQVKATYWTIGHISMYGKKELKISMRIDGYVSEEAYLNGAPALDESKHISFKAEKEDYVDLFKFAYKYIKEALPEFENAEDLL